MNIISRLRRDSSGFLGRLMATSLAVCGLGIASTSTYATGTTVTIDQAPLIVQASLPPNITLMLDDSGSMAWDYMPDWGYLSDTSDDGVRNASVNGTYYNPTVTYSPPPKADGTFYPASPSLTGAYKDGFSDTSAVDVTSYTGGNSTYANTFPYYTTVTIITLSTYAATGRTQYSCPSGYSGPDSSNKCKKTSNPNIGTFIPATATLTYSCNAGDVLNGTQCTKTTTSYKNFFTYTTGSGNTQHYVGQTGDCASLTAAQQAVCDDSTATQQNVANWFSYYRTRILMAKSGLMNSFITINAKYRVGFGSIDGGDSGNSNYLNLPTDRYSYSDAYSGGTNYIAQVKPFGDGSVSTDQKNAFWKWVKGAKASGGTPLRQALNAVGTYYTQDQPWSSMSSDPDPNASELACRQSYTILTTDGFWNESNSPGVGDADGTSATAVTGPNGQSYTYTPVSPYSDSAVTTTAGSYKASCPSQYSLTQVGNVYQCTRFGKTNQAPTCPSGGSLSPDQSKCLTTTTGPNPTYSNTLADVAMKYWSTDLRTASNEVPTSTEDPAFWQHMTTFTLGLGFTPVYTDKVTPIPVSQVFAWANGDASQAISGFTWPKPAGDSIYNIADLAHAAVNGHGGFYSATSPQSFSQGLKDALKRASERVGTGASLAANSTQLQTGTVAYQANYYTAKWKGDLKALAVDSTSGAISATAAWTASSALPTPANRVIYTYNPSGASASTQYVVFNNGTSSAPALSAAQLTALASSTAAQMNIVNYLRGDGSLEMKHLGGTYRTRDTPLGDIIDSQPVYAGAPSPNQFNTESFTGSGSFATYASNNASRAGRIYVAANDGMLHAFDASSGAETYAYLPGAVITHGLSNLANPDYGTDTLPHAYFNDGELTIADAYIGSPVGWKTVLVGTTGRGLAKAVYALDITDPTSIKFLWERSAGDGLTNSTYIGQMTGKPVIAQTADGSWSVLMGNGYNSAAGVAALLQFNLADGTLNVHATTDTTGLAAPGVWMDPAGNGVSTIAYAGDASGDVWSFAFADSSGAATPNSAGTKLFTALDGSNKAQPITGGILVGKDPGTGNTWVFFGTGKYLTAADLADTSTQSWYGLIVQSSTSGLAVTSATTRSNGLVSRSITGQTAGNATASPPVLPARTITTAQNATDINGKSGWYIDLLAPTGTGGAAVNEGERMVTSNQFQGNLLLGTTRIPKATDACNPSGNGWIMAINPFSGTNPSQAFFDVNGDGKIDSSDLINGVPAAGVGFSSLPNNPIFVGSTMLTSFDNGTTGSLKTSNSTGNMTRVSWRELINP
jgi:type IV pilus assembly protein PilY1